MSRKEPVQISHPTIAEVLEEFLADQRERLGAGSIRKYESVLDLLQHSLNGYAYQSLGKEEAAFFDRVYNAKGEEHREFCEVFGPEYIQENVGEFLNYFMVRKVIAGKEMLRAAGTVTKKLAGWLAAKGYVKPEDAGEMLDRGAAAARDLPKAEELAGLLREFADARETGDERRGVEDHFTITRVEGGKLWLQGMMDGREIGPISLPEEISRRCRVGWTISGVVGRTGKRWRLIEAWNVYPD